MLSEDDLEVFVAEMRKRFTNINLFFIRRIAEQIQIAGELNASSVHQLLTLLDNDTTLLEVATQLRQALGITLRELVAICNQAAQDVTTDPRFAQALRRDPTGNRQRQVQARVRQYAQSVAAQSSRDLTNLTNTTAVSQTYRDLASQAVLAVSSGLTDYKSACSQIIQQLGYNGLQVFYESGYHRRLDSAIRQNVIDAVRQINQHGSDIMGEELGFDAVEISAHANSAPDHEPVQGRVFLRSEFEKMQAGLDFVDVDGRRYEGFLRPIGNWNCMHFAMAFSTQHSVRRYTDEQLQAWKQKNNDGFEYNGKQRTLYWATQKMRALETDVRRWKDAANAAKAADDMEGRKRCQKKINDIVKRYEALCTAAGMPQHKDRMVVEGFRMVKV